MVGDSGAGKSESIEALKSLAFDKISEMTIIFDDMGTFVNDDNKVKAYGTEIGAFVRLDDLEAGYAFKELDRSIFMNPDKINARLITPVSSYLDIMQGLEVDLLLYANNYEAISDGEVITVFNDIEKAKKVFIEGQRMAKGTTSENGLSKSFFANPFGPYQKQEETLLLIDEFFDKMASDKTIIGEIYTQLGIVGMEKAGPINAATELLEKINKK